MEHLFQNVSLHVRKHVKYGLLKIYRVYGTYLENSNTVLLVCSFYIQEISIDPVLGTEDIEKNKVPVFTKSTYIHRPENDQCYRKINN